MLLYMFKLLKSISSLEIMMMQERIPLNFLVDFI